MKILYVEDDPTAREYIQKGLRERGHHVDTAADGIEALRLLEDAVYELILLDVGLPEIDGFELLRRIRSADDRTAVLMLSARAEVSDRVEGLNLGADDYLAKPFAFAELLARIQAITRRTAAEPDDGTLRLLDLSLDLRAYRARRGQREITLTRKEFSLLEYLMRNSNQVVSRTMITEYVWGPSFDAYSNVIDVHMTHLRKKVDQGEEVKLLHTVKGVGYILQDRRSSEA